MQKTYLFGAGINCAGVIKFLGVQNIEAVIDNDGKKIGRLLEGVPIISFDEYLSNADGCPIFITAYMNAAVIHKQIAARSKTRCYISPYIQTGYYEDAEDVVKKLQLEQYQRILFQTEDPIAQRIVEVLRHRNTKIEIQYIEEIDASGDEMGPIIVTCEITEEGLEALKTTFRNAKILVLSKIYNEHFRVNTSDLSKFKGIHKGKRCFIIGNGPSLTYEDLDTLHLHAEVCFGANRIYLGFEHTQWRPDYYVAVDYFALEKDREQIQRLEGTKFIRQFYKMEPLENQIDTYYFMGKSYEPGDPQLSFDLEDGIYFGNTVIYDAIQIAVYMGFSEIYLLGVDMTSGVRAEDEGGHFYKTVDKNECFGIGNRNEALSSLRYIGEKLKDRGCILKNATRGGELEELERVSFDSLF